MRYSISGCFGTYSAGTKAFAASGSEEGGVLVWDVSGKEVLQRLEGNDGGGRVVLGVDADRSGTRMVSGGVDGVVRVWCLEGEEEGEEGRGRQEATAELAAEADGEERQVEAKVDVKVEEDAMEE